jgi:hypothetical protein
MQARRASVPTFIAVLSALAVPAAAQGLWTIDASGNASEHNGPSALPCGAPLGPLLAQWSYDVPGPCATPNPLGAGFQGDIGMDRTEDLLWITDGTIAAGYQTFGTPITTGVNVTGLLGAPVTGMDWDPAIGGIWVTDGQDVASAAIVFNGTCYEASLLSTFALPIAHQATALSHDPLTNTLWVVDDGGFLTQVTKAGALGPMGSKLVTGLGCLLSTSLTGVAADTAGPAGRVYVTDGSNVAAVFAAGASAILAPGTFYSPLPCYASPVGSVRGLVTAATGNVFGSGSGPLFPSIGHKGQSIVPNSTLAIEVGGAHQNEIGILVLGPSYLCPPLSVLGVPFHISPTPLITLATTVIGPTGFASIPLPLGVGTPIGHTVFLQWGLIDPVTFKASSTRGLALTTSLP